MEEKETRKVLWQVPPGLDEDPPTFPPSPARSHSADPRGTIFICWLLAECRRPILFDSLEPTVNKASGRFTAPTGWGEETNTG